MNLIKKSNPVTFPSLLDELFKPDWFGGMEGMRMNVPAVNIKENDTTFTLELAAPGKKKEDFNIVVDENVLTISSENKVEKEEKADNGKYTRREFSYSSFRRSFTLPETVDEDKINAHYENGVLILTLPKREEALPKPKRMIEIE